MGEKKLHNILGMARWVLGFIQAFGLTYGIRASLTIPSPGFEMANLFPGGTHFDSRHCISNVAW